MGLGALACLAGAVRPVEVVRPAADVRAVRGVAVLRAAVDALWAGAERPAAEARSAPPRAKVSGEVMSQESKPATTSAVPVFRMSYPQG